MPEHAIPIRRRHALAVLPAGPTLAQGRPLRLMVGFPPGASLDLLAEPLGLLLGRPVVVENRAGGGGRVAAASPPRPWPGPPAIQT